MTEGFTDNLWLGTAKESETGKGMPVVMVKNARKSSLPLWLNCQSGLQGQARRSVRVSVTIGFGIA